MTIKQIIILVSVAAICRGAKHEKQSHPITDNPLMDFDRHVSHILEHHYLWPWSQLLKAAAAFDSDEDIDDTKITTDPNKFEIKMDVKSYDPEDLHVKVNHQYLLVESKHKITTNRYNKFFTKHFVQRYSLPAGCRPEEVTATLKNNGILYISAPRHTIPPPPPEREVPIVIEKAEEEPTTEQTIEETKATEPSTTEKKLEDLPTSPSTPIEDLDVVEATTHLGKIRKKELKSGSKTAKDNEVTKGDDNGLDFTYIEV